MAPTTYSSGLPRDLAAAPLRTITPRAAAPVYAVPGPELRRLESRGLLHRVARGYYVAVPPERVGTGWKPALEPAAAGIGTAIAGHAVVMGLSAARLHGAVPRSLAVAVVALPRQHREVAFIDRPARAVFVARRLEMLDVESMASELGRVSVTTPEQTVLDLAHRSDLGDAPTDARAAVASLLTRCSAPRLQRLAGEQRRRASLDRAMRWGA